MYGNTLGKPWILHGFTIQIYGVAVNQVWDCSRGSPPGERINFLFIFFKSLFGFLCKVQHQPSKFGTNWSWDTAVWGRLKARKASSSVNVTKHTSKALLPNGGEDLLVPLPAVEIYWDAAVDNMFPQRQFNSLGPLDTCTQDLQHMIPGAWHILGILEHLWCRGLGSLAKAGLFSWHFMSY